jgi:hypothetical protein
MPFTGLIHAARLRDRFANFYSTDRFFEDAANGTPAELLVHRASPDLRPQRHAPARGRAVPGLSFVNGEHRSTSLIHTLRQRWSLGEPGSA